MLKAIQVSYRYSLYCFCTLLIIGIITISYHHFFSSSSPNHKGGHSATIRIERLPEQVHIITKQSPQQHKIYAINNYPAPVSLSIHLLSQENTVCDIHLPYFILLPPYSTSLVLNLSPKDTRYDWYYDDSYHAVLGDMNAVHHPPHPYRPPIDKQGHFFISQAFNGEFSHNHDESRYAVDIVMPVGTPIYAARAGRVVELKNNFSEGNTNKATDPQHANLIRLLHHDGTIAVYAHLAKQSIKVSLGQWVVEGQLIALSGNTGFSSGPHLHFAIQKNVNMRLTSLPFRFYDKQGRAFTPRVHQFISLQ